MCNIKVVLKTNDTEEIIENVTQIDFDLAEILITTFMEPVRVITNFKPVIIDFLEGNVVLEQQIISD